MFWRKKTKKAPTKRQATLAQAQEAMAAKRAEIGDDTLEEIRRAITKHESSITQQAKRQIMAADQGKVLDNLKYMMNEKS